MTTITLTDNEIELLSQALGEAVAAQEKAVNDCDVEMAKWVLNGGKKGTGSRILASLQSRHTELLALMNKIDNA